MADDSNVGVEEVTEATAARIKMGLDYLASKQVVDPKDPEVGYWVEVIGRKVNDEYRGHMGRHVGVTALACMAFLSNGSTPGRGPYGEQVARGLNFILSRVNKDDGFITADESRMYEHAFATLFLAHAYGMSPREDVRAKLRRAVTLIVQAQNPEGGWRYQPQPVDADLSVTVSTLQALRAARNVGIAVPVGTIQRATKYVEGCATYAGFKYQSDDVHVNNDTRVSYALTAAGVVSLYSAGVYDGEPVRRGIRRLSNYRELHWGKYHYFYGHYYACQALWMHGGDLWTGYYAQLRGDILRNQEDDGSWKDDVGVSYATAMGCLLLALPTEWFPIFQK